MNRPEMSLEDRLDFIEYRQQLLFSNTPYDRLLFEFNITANENQAIGDLFESYRKKIGEKQEVFSHQFESEMFEIVPHLHGNYHFVEFITKELHEERRWEEVFVALYREDPKFQSYMSKKSRV
ncbi:DUF1878 domain-containing protein [Peribacillus sp. NPDC097295]|uniref:DUF1878 domain-containing protein n=1 Tax=Peribacillus sp. NPDC097295 TaxID=3364402 RepID=UPI00381D2C70